MKALEECEKGRCLYNSLPPMKKENTHADIRCSLCITSPRLTQFLLWPLPGVRVIRRAPSGYFIVILPETVSFYHSSLLAERKAALILNVPRPVEHSKGKLTWTFVERSRNRSFYTISPQIPISFSFAFDLRLKFL